MKTLDSAIVIIYMNSIYFKEPSVRTARLFRNGQSQAVRLPKEFRFEGDFVYVKKSGNGIVLLPAKGAWSSLVGSLDKFSDDFMTERRQPEAQKREAL
jgi:antitoxin VapB